MPAITNIWNTGLSGQTRLFRICLSIRRAPFCFCVLSTAFFRPATETAKRESNGSSSNDKGRGKHALRWLYWTDRPSYKRLKNPPIVLWDSSKQQTDTLQQNRALLCFLLFQIKSNNRPVVFVYKKASTGNAKRSLYTVSCKLVCSFGASIHAKAWQIYTTVPPFFTKLFFASIYIVETNHKIRPKRNSLIL